MAIHHVLYVKNNNNNMHICLSKKKLQHKPIGTERTEKSRSGV